MTANTQAETICLHYQVPEGIQFDGAALNKAIASNIGLCLALDMPNDNVPRDHCSIFHDSYMPCENKAKSRAKQWCYYATNIGGKPAKDSKSWFNDLTTDLVSVTVTHSKNQKLSPATQELIVDLTATTHMSSTASEGLDAASSLPTPPPQRLPTTLPTSLMTTKQPTDPIVIPPAEQFCWLLTEAAMLFVPKKNKTVLEGINAQITILQEANKTHVSYLNVLDRGEEEKPSTKTHLHHIKCGQ